MTTELEVILNAVKRLNQHRDSSWEGYEVINEPESLRILPEGGTILSVYSGYSGFVTEMHFNRDGKLTHMAAWE